MNFYNIDKDYSYKINKFDTITDEWCSRKEFGAYKRYTQNGYFDKINSALRFGFTPDPFVNDDILALDKLFQSLPNKLRNKTPLEVYRGTVLTQELKDIIEGKTQSNIYTDKAFVSTSKSKQVAEQFAQKEEGIIMHISIPKGSCIIDDENLPSYAGSKLDAEKEVLLPRNSQFRVLSYNPQTKIIEAEYIGQKQPLGIPRTTQEKQVGQDILADLNKKFLIEKITIKNEIEKPLYNT